ncbi:MAG: N-acetylneuraminate synthase family protein [Marinibacterium sp.]|nr:N-acetylneuraminate synthase family protein [Marinibacterium sp.]
MTFVEKLADEQKAVIIGEIGQNHDGSLGLAHAYIDALADAGADAIKFQTHIAAAETTLDDQFRVKFSYQDETRYDYWRRMEFTEPQWAELKRHADERHIAFLSTPFSAAAVDLLKRTGVEAWKIGSGDTVEDTILQPILKTGKPLIVSSGMSSWSELDAAVARLTDASASFCLLQCTSKYPTPMTDVGINVMPEMRERYGCRVGLSDHSGSLSPSLSAIARGYSLIEVHATFDKRMFGPDVVASLTIEDIARLVRFAGDQRIMDANPVDKDKMANELCQQKQLFGRSLAPVRDLPQGHVLTEGDLTLKKPGGGLPWSDRGEFIGRALARDVLTNRLLKIEDIT